VKAPARPHTSRATRQCSSRVNSRRPLTSTVDRIGRPEGKESHPNFKHSRRHSLGHSLQRHSLTTHWLAKRLTLSRTHKMGQIGKCNSCLHLSVTVTSPLSFFLPSFVTLVSYVWRFGTPNVSPVSFGSTLDRGTNSHEERVVWVGYSDSLDHLARDQKSAMATVWLEIRRSTGRFVGRMSWARLELQPRSAGQLVRAGYCGSRVSGW